ncbi:methionine synthase [Corynebacterium stationis]|uniref:methionine synthase n=1 Tax=Corynebacterium stationis TaxID=1705 RepID=UPI00263A8D90|nr:methionine synthase [Corynebacterium stationis]
MTAFGLGPGPGTDIALAADIIAGETGDKLHLPQLPTRGLGSDAIGRTAGLLEAVSVDRGPRSWRLTDRPQLASRAMWDRMDRDLDILQELWGDDLDNLKVQVIGPWTLAASLELSNGHRAITDSGALRDLTAALHAGLDEHIRDLKNRFHCDIAVQIDEPLYGDVLAGLKGTTDFDPVRPVPSEVAADAIEQFDADLLNFTGQHPNWEAARVAKTAVIDVNLLTTDQDGIGEHIEEGHRLALAINPFFDDGSLKDSRQVSISIAKAWDRIGHSRIRLTTNLDIVPATAGESLKDMAAAYRFVAEIAGILERDAGDL